MMRKHTRTGDREDSSASWNPGPREGPTGTTFLNQPHVSESGEKAHLAFIGACFDGLDRQPGVAEGPQRIREAASVYANSDGTSQPITIYNPELGFLLDGVRFVDQGDIHCGSDVEVAREMLERAVSEAIAASQVPLLVGGDHFVTYPAIRALAEPVVVLHLDAHSDYLEEFESCPHGSFMRKVGDLVHVRRIVHLGLRGNLQTGAGIQYSLSRGNRLVTSRQLSTRGVAILAELLDPEVLRGEWATYVTFDVDVLDPSVAPGTGTPEPGGISYLAARDLLVALCQKTRVIGLDFTEFNPRLDWNGLTAKVVANLIIESASALVKRWGPEGSGVPRAS